MKQKIKKLAYTIPLDSDYIHDANIVVAEINVPSKKDKKQTAISISLNLNDDTKDITHPEWKVIIPKRKVKELRKALKRICKD